MEATPTTSLPAGAKKQVTLTIDGKSLKVDARTTIWDAAKQAGIDIPGLCHKPEMDYPAVGVCRLCSVSVIKRGKPERVFAAACLRECEEGMVVVAGDHAEHEDEATAKIRQKLCESRKTLVELLLAEHPVPCKRQKESIEHRELGIGECELEGYGKRYGLLNPQYKTAAEAWAKPTIFNPRAPQYIPAPDNSNFSIAIDHSACILCDRCVRACGHPSVDNRVIGRTGKGAQTRIGFDNDLPMKESSCVNCGWCMVSCPTGAITYAGAPKSPKPPWDQGMVLLPEQMLEIDLIREGKISVEFLKRSEGGAVIHWFNKGEILCRQGEYGRTAFYIQSGSVEVYLGLPQKREAEASRPGLLSRWFGSRPATTATKTRTTPIPVGDMVDLDPIKPVARLGEGTLFGEEACLNGQARSATIEVAQDGTEIVIMFRNFLDILTRNRQFRAKLEEKYRRWAVENQLRTSPYLQGLTPEFREKLRDRATIARYKPEEAIVTEGDVADAFYMIRLGHVKVQQKLSDGSTLLLRYMTAGEVFGEIGVLLCERRTASCIAMDNVQLVRIAKEDFDELVSTFPEIKKRLIDRAVELLRNEGANVVQDAEGHVVRIERSRAPKPLPIKRTPALQEYMTQELYQGQHMLVLDLDKCTRCDECVNACAQSHLGISRLIRDGLRYDKYLVPTSCRSCRDPKCLVGCPVDAIHRKGSLPIVIEDHCVGCGRCAENCPFGNIAMLPVTLVEPDGKVQEGRQAAVCNLDNCIEEDREPSCVYACPHDAAHRVDGPKFFGVDVLGPRETEMPV